MRACARVRVLLRDSPHKQGQFIPACKLLALCKSYLRVVSAKSELLDKLLFLFVFLADESSVTAIHLPCGKFSREAVIEILLVVIKTAHPNFN